ncbi:MAG: Flp pilus assembly complex ATPase component TadA [Planctomycetes bacterium]|nr:Flp pilus assembly complex ATPase component TadA [Planctomycetota bacterium]
MNNSRLEPLLQAMERVSASAIYLVPGRPPCMRVQRRVVELDARSVSADQIDEFVRDLLFTDHRETLASTGQVEVLYLGQDGRRYRAVVTECGGKRTMTLRPLPTKVPTFEALELPDQVAGFARHRSGLVLTGGFFGSGKSTLLAAIVDVLNADPTRHIVTIEDAIEFVHRPDAALLHQQEIGVHVENAIGGIRQAVAAGVDTIVVSEVHDRETLNEVITAVESGALVFCGVESGSVVGALTEVVLRAPLEERARLRTRLARALRGVTAQYLLPRAHRSGRVAVVEILVGSPAVRGAIRSGNFQELPGIMHRCRGLGMQTAEAALRALQSAHLVSDEDAQLYLPQREGQSGAAPSLAVR